MVRMLNFLRMPKVYLEAGRFDTNVVEDLMEMCLTSLDLHLYKVSHDGSTSRSDVALASPAQS